MTKKPLLKNKDNDFIEDWATVMAAPFGKLGVKTTFTENSLFISEILYVSQLKELISPKNALAQQRLAATQADPLGYVRQYGHPLVHYLFFHLY